MASNHVNILLLHVSFILYKSILLRHIVILFSSHITKACYQYNGSDVYHLLFVYLSFIHNIDSESVNISIIYKNLEGYEWQSGLVHTDHHPNTKNQEKLPFLLVSKDYDIHHNQENYYHRISTKTKKNWYHRISTKIKKNWYPRISTKTMKNLYPRISTKTMNNWYPRKSTRN